MDETQLRLDGNAAAGMLRELFAYDLKRCAWRMRLLRSDRADR